MIAPVQIAMTQRLWPAKRYKPGQLVAVKMKRNRDRRSRTARSLPWVDGIIGVTIPAGARPGPYLAWKTGKRDRRLDRIPASPSLTHQVRALVTRKTLTIAPPQSLRATNTAFLTVDIIARVEAAFGKRMEAARRAS